MDLLTLHIKKLIKNYKTELEYTEKQWDKYEPAKCEDSFYAGKLASKLEVLRKTINDLEKIISYNNYNLQKSK